MRGACLIVFLLVSSSALADHADALREADRKLAEGEATEAETVAAALVADPTVSPGERAQAHRIRGLALFYLDRRAEAEAALRAYLQHEPEARLDPALVPPEAVVFFEGVRAKHAGELRIAKPPPRRRRTPALNFFPPFGQFQNGDRTKGWIIAGAGVTLLSINVATYTMLTSSCGNDLTCERSATASRRMRVMNIASGIGAIALYGYAVVDGLIGYQRNSEAPRPWAIAPMIDGGLGTVGAQAAFSF